MSTKEINEVKIRQFCINKAMFALQPSSDLHHVSAVIEYAEELFSYITHNKDKFGDKPKEKNVVKFEDTFVSYAWNPEKETLGQYLRRIKK